MVNEHDIELVESFLEGKLQGKDLEAFFERQKSDPEFAQFIEVRKMIGDAWPGAADYLEAKQWVGDTIENHVRNKQRFKNKMIWYSLAAVVLTFIGIMVILEINTRNVEDGSLLASDTTSVEVTQTGSQDQKASIDTAFIEAVLSSPTENVAYSKTDSIAFIWDQPNYIYKELVICLSSNDSVITTFVLTEGQTRYILYPDKLMPGFYYWYLDKPYTKGYFKINKEE